MEKTYKIEMCDNGWTMEDPDDGIKEVVEERRSDTGHSKFKQRLGNWLYTDIDDFFDEIEDVKCLIEIKFKEDGEVRDDKA